MNRVFCLEVGIAGHCGGRAHQAKHAMRKANAFDAVARATNLEVLDPALALILESLP